MSGCNCPWRAVRLFWSNKLTTTSTNHWFFRPIINGVTRLSSALLSPLCLPPNPYILLKLYNEFRFFVTRFTAAKAYYSPV